MDEVDDLYGDLLAFDDDLLLLETPKAGGVNYFCRLGNPGLLSHETGIGFIFGGVW